MTTVTPKKQLSDEIRRLICRKYDLGKNTSVISSELDLNYQTVNSIIKVYKETQN